MGYADGTTVPVARTRGEIEALVEKYGAQEFSGGWTVGQAAIQFTCKGRRVRFVVRMPDREWATAKLRKRWPYGTIPPDKITEVIKAEERRLWRCLLISIKAKLEAVQTGIATFDEEFLAHIVVDNQTIYERLTSFEGGHLLPAVGE